MLAHALGIMADGATSPSASGKPSLASWALASWGIGAITSVSSGFTSVSPRARTPGPSCGGVREFFLMNMFGKTWNKKTVQHWPQPAWVFVSQHGPIQCMVLWWLGRVICFIPLSHLLENVALASPEWGDNSWIVWKSKTIKKAFWICELLVKPRIFSDPLHRISVQYIWPSPYLDILQAASIYVVKNRMHVALCKHKTGKVPLPTLPLQVRAGFAVSDNSLDLRPRWNNWTGAMLYQCIILWIYLDKKKNSKSHPLEKTSPEGMPLLSGS